MTMTATTWTWIPTISTAVTTATTRERVRPVQTKRPPKSAAVSFRSTGRQSMIRKVGTGFPSRQTRNAFARRSCSNNKLERDDASSRNHRALGGADLFTGYVGFRGGDPVGFGFLVSHTSFDRKADHAGALGQPLSGCTDRAPVGADLVAMRCRCNRDQLSPHAACEAVRCHRRSPRIK